VGKRFFYSLDSIFFIPAVAQVAIKKAASPGSPARWLFVGRPHNERGLNLALET
jgi:hypothetical protein